MTDESEEMRAFKSLYADIIGHGSLKAAVQDALRGVGSPLGAVDMTDSGARNFVAYARVEQGPRFSQIYMAQKERLFLFDFWDKGVCMANAKSAELSTTATAIHDWITSSCRVAELKARHPFVVATPDAEQYEHGTIVEARWQEYLAHLPAQFPDLGPILQAAAARQELRQLFPFTSMTTFCLSRCTGYPFTTDTPSVTPLGHDDYEVRSGKKKLGRGNAQIAIELVVRGLPPNCGPAVAGTAEDLAKGTKR